jgi:hypothetical protein
MALEPDQLREHVLLETRAVYRVIAVGDELVQVEVIEAPGLPAGHRLNLTRQAVSEMRLLTAYKPWTTSGTARSAQRFHTDPPRITGQR